MDSLSSLFFHSQPAIAGILQEGRRSLAKTERGLGTARARLGAARARLAWGGFAAGKKIVPKNYLRRIRYFWHDFSQNLKVQYNFSKEIPLKIIP